MTSRYLAGRHPVVGAIGAPIVRIWDSGPAGRIAAILAAAAQAIWHDMVFGFLVLLLFTALMDWWLGRAAARRRGDYSHQVSEWGLQSKFAGVLIVGVIRYIEYLLTTTGLPDTRGIMSVAIAAALIYQDLDSIDGHRQTLGGRPIPILSAVLGLLRRISDSLLPVDPGEGDK